MQRELTGSDIALTKATMVVYNLVANARTADDPELRTLLSVTKLNQDAVTAYVEYVKAAVAEQKSHERDQRKQWLCNRCAEIKTGDQLAVTLVKIDSNIESQQAKSIAGSESVLGADGKRLLDSYIPGTRSMLKIVEVDPTKVARFGADKGMSIADVTEKLCPTIGGR